MKYMQEEKIFNRSFAIDCNCQELYNKNKLILPYTVCVRKLNYKKKRSVSLWIAVEVALIRAVEVQI